VSIVNEINETISLFFPKNVGFDEFNYVTSTEYKNLIEIRQRYLLNQDVKNDIKKSLEELYKEYAVMDWTDLPHSNCYEFKILMHKNQPILDGDLELIRCLGWRRLDLRVFISILNTYYYYFFEESTYDIDVKEWRFRKIAIYDQEMQDATNILDNMMTSKGYRGLTTEIVSKVVEEVETEYLEKGKVKIFHCLFTDLVTV